MAIAEAPVSIENIGELRMNPFLSRDNCFLLDVNLAVGELGRFSELGGDTVVDPTNFGIGRDPEALQRIARRTKLNIVMGSGFYLEPSHPDWFTAHGSRRGDGLHRRRMSAAARRSPTSWRASSARSAISKDLHPGRGEVAAGRRARLPHHRRAAVDPPAGLGAAGASRARRRGERGRGPRPTRSCAT